MADVVRTACRVARKEAARTVGSFSSPLEDK